MTERWFAKVGDEKVEINSTPSFNKLMFDFIKKLNDNNIEIDVKFEGRFKNLLNELVIRNLNSMDYNKEKLIKNLEWLIRDLKKNKPVDVTGDLLYMLEHCKD